MGIARKVISVVATMALAVTLVGAGFLACTAPFVTNALANFTSDDATSPFSRSQLVQVADATRDYSFGAHDKLALYQTIYEVDLQLRQEIVTTGGAVPAGFPDLDSVTDRSSESELAGAFSKASELYCFSPETISHLDDCYSIASVAYIALGILAVVVVAGLVVSGILGRKRLVGTMVLVAGVVVVVLIVALGVFAAIDFERFFALFHQVFFSQGNWVFPYDSLLICALPTGFWIGMGAAWLVVTALASILSIVIGKRLR